MRQISGAWRANAGLELTADPAVDVFATADHSVAVLHHTTSRLDARTLLEQYRQHGVAAIEQREDDCAVVLFDQASRTLILARDETGTTPCYYSLNAGVFAFGTRIADVLACLQSDTTPNRVALAQLLVHHAPYPGETLFEGVAAVPPGGMLVNKDQRIDVVPARARAVRTHPWRYDDAVSEFRRLLRQALGRRIDANGATAILVSGGLDSSALLCMAAEAGDVFGINYGVHDDRAADESRYMAALRRTGLRIDEIPFFPAFDIESAERSVRQTEMPSLEMVPLTLERAAAQSAAHGAGRLLIGTWGDQVLAPFPPAHHTTLAPWRAAALARSYHRYMSDVPQAQIRRALFRQGLRRYAPDRVLQKRRERRAARSIFDELARSVGISGPVERIADYGSAVQRAVFSGTAMSSIEMTTKWGNAQGLETALPFLDRDLVSFLSTLPDEIAYRQHALKPLLRDALEGIMPDEIRDRRDKGDYTAAMTRSAPTPKTVLDLLDGLRRPLQFGLMSPASVRNTLARIERGSNIWSEPGDLAAVVALDVWLRLFFEK